MENRLKEVLLEEGVDYDAAIHRFCGREDLYREFLKQFLEDENCENLRDSLKEGNVKEAFKCAHTLKGLCGNLGLEKILEYDRPLVELLRGGELEGTMELYDNMMIQYESLCQVLRASL